MAGALTMAPVTILATDGGRDTTAMETASTTVVIPLAITITMTGGTIPVPAGTSVVRPAISMVLTKLPMRAIHPPIVMAIPDQRRVGMLTGPWIRTRRSLM